MPKITIEVEMTAVQLARVEKLANAMNMKPGDLMRTLTLMDMDSFMDTDMRRNTSVLVPP